MKTYYLYFVIRHQTDCGHIGTTYGFDFVDGTETRLVQKLKYVEENKEIQNAFLNQIHMTKVYDIEEDKTLNYFIHIMILFCILFTSSKSTMISLSTLRHSMPWLLASSSM